jgi:hypothetical protein
VGNKKLDVFKSEKMEAFFMSLLVSYFCGHQLLDFTKTNKSDEKLK